MPQDPAPRRTTPSLPHIIPPNGNATATNPHLYQRAMLTAAMAAAHGAAGDDDSSATGSLSSTPHKSTSKTRSLSDSAPPRLEPSPKFHEPARMSKDDQHALLAGPSTPRRPDVLTRGLSLQMPARDATFVPAPMHSPAHFAASRVPLSPQLDARNTYASPASLLPRRSRGAEFSRACTNLHHSTLPDQSSPDSSPTITQKGIKIPSSRPSSMLLDSPNVNAHGGWGDRTAASSSMGSINMMGSDDSSSSSDDLDPMDPDDGDDPMIMTPQALKTTHPFPPVAGSSTSPWANPFSPSGMPNFMSIQRARLRKGRSRKSSSSGHSSLASPGPASPPNGSSKGEGYFAREAAIAKRKAGSRRESLSLFANDLNISSGNDSGDEASAFPRTPGVVRRPVTRRGNLLPKSRQFGRIKAELFEEAAPIDSEVRREAEIIRQVRESDDPFPPSHTAQSSPTLLASTNTSIITPLSALPSLDSPLDSVSEDSGLGILDSSSAKGLFGAFGSLNALHRASSAGASSMWHRPAQTPPPPFRRAESTAVSEDMNMALDSPTVSSSASFTHPSSTANLPQGTTATVPQSYPGYLSRASTPGMAPPTAADALKKSNKRRRDDDLDEGSIKRRAVSPGVSAGGSPGVGMSPAHSVQSSQSQGQGQGQGRNGSASAGASAGGVAGNGGAGHAHAERSNSGTSTTSVSMGGMTPSFGPKRVGLQGMTDTSDGFMKMSIE